MRIVSLLPSATETVCALGQGEALVGRSEECDYPVEVGRLPVVMRARTLDSARPSAEIDARVRAARATSESLYELDVPLLSRLRPDVVLTQDLCGVCSVTESEVHTACQAAGIDPEIVSLTPRTLSEVWASIDRVGEAIGATEAAERLTSRLRRSSVAVESADGSPRPSVAVIEWVDPPILAGLWTPDIIEGGAGRPVGPGAGEPGQRTDWAAVAAARPDLVVLAPCSFNVARARRELESAPVDSPVRSLRPRLGFWIADEAYFSRPGPRLGEGVRLVRALAGGLRPSTSMPVERWTPGAHAR